MNDIKDILSYYPTTKHMTEIYDTDDKFGFDDLVFLKPIAVTGGNYFIRIRKNNSALYIQPPQCKTKQGIIKAGKKYYSDLMFTNENEDFVRWMETLESLCQKTIFDNRSIWFEGDMDLHDIENYFTSPLKIYKSGKYYISRTNISLYQGEPMLKIYDENETQIDMDSINDKTNIMTVLEVQGIKCSARSFQIELELKQIMTVVASDIFEKCVLKTKENGATLETIPHPIHEEPKAVSSEIITVPTSEDSIVHKIEITSEKNDTPSDNQFRIDDLEEIEFDLEELPKEEIVQLKQRNDVYYEMYREAKRKARVARDLALSSYLEAKRIKNTYMLDEIKDSDESEDSEDSEDSDLEPEKEPKP